MRFGPTPLDEAEGSILAHTLRLPDGSVLRKSHRLTAEDVERLRTAGESSPVVVRLAPDDVDENEAAQRIARALAGSGVDVEPPRAGRCNLIGRADGLVLVDGDRVSEMNRGDEGVQIATLNPFERVGPHALVATVKVVPFAVPAALLHSLLEPTLDAKAGIRVEEFRPLRVALVLTRLSGTSDKAVQVARTRVEARVAKLGGTMHSVAECAHDAEALEEGLRCAAGAGPDLLLVFGASATLHRNDVVPRALELAGGAVDRLGMPVDPGNLLLLGKLEGLPVLGVPGCARSPAPSGFDQVLARMFAGVPPSGRDLAALGVGGLLRETSDRPSPRRPRPANAPAIAGVVLGAGFSRRMGTTNKLLADIDGVPMVRRVAETAVAADLDPVVVVTGHDAGGVRSALDGLPLSFAHNERAEDGLSSSLAVGLAALPPGCAGAAILLGDMPWVTPADIAALRGAFASGDRASICVPVHGRRRGNPVLWSSLHFAEMSRLEGDQGARHLLATYADTVREVPVGHPGVLRDIDTLVELSQLAHASDPTPGGGGHEGAPST